MPVPIGWEIAPKPKPIVYPKPEIPAQKPKFVKPEVPPEPPKEVFLTGPEFEKVFGVKLPTGWDVSYIWDKAETAPIVSVYAPGGVKVALEDIGISPTGEWVYGEREPIVKEDRFAVPEGTLPVEERLEYFRYQAQLRLEDILSEVFITAAGVEQARTLASEDPDAFIDAVAAIGRTDATEDLLLELGLTEAELDMVFGETPEQIAAPAITEDGTVLNKGFLGSLWDAVQIGARSFLHRTAQYFVSTLPNLVFKDVEVGQRREIAVLPFMAPEWGAPYSEEEARGVNQFNQTMRDKFRKIYIENQVKNEEWIVKHPDLQPPPRYKEDITQNLELLKDSGYWAYVIGEAATFSLAILGTTLGVAFATKNPYLGLAAGTAMATPAQSQDLYEDLLASGAPEDKASDIAVPIGMVIALVEAVTDLPLLKAIAPAFNLFKKNIQKAIINQTMLSLFKKGVTTFTTIEVVESLEEIAQGAIHNAFVKTYDEDREIFENLDETIIKTLIATTPFAIFGGGMSMRHIPTEVASTVPPEVKKSEGWQQDPITGEWYKPEKMVDIFDENIDRLSKEGLDADQAKMKALTEAARTPEGEKAISKFIGQVKRFITEERGAIGRPEEEAKPPVVPEVKVPLEREVVSETGEPISPDATIPQGVVKNIPIIQDIGVKERWVRPTRKVFERMDLYVPYKGIQRAEVELGEANMVFAKKLKAVSKTVEKPRRHLIFRELENPGSQVGLTFNEKRAVIFFRENFNKWADALNLPQEKRLKNYITHIFEADIEEQLKEKHPLDPAIARALEDRTPKTIFNPFLQERLGATIGLIEDPFAAALAYESRQLRVFYYEPLLRKIEVIANDINTPTVFRDYLLDYSRRLTKQPSKLDQSINNTLREFAGAIEKLPGGKPFASFLTRGNPSGMAAYQFTGVIYTLWLGFKPTSAIRNLSQHTLIIGEVGPVHFAKGLGLRLTAEGKAALDESLVLRSRKAAFIPGIDDSFVDKWTDKFREAALWMFRMADKQNVSDAFLAGYSEAKSLLPEADRQVWIDRGDEVAADTQYLYTQMNSMAISQSSMGRVFAILTTWSQNWVELMAKWIARRPSQVYKQYEKETGKKVVGANWSTSLKAIGMYMAIVGLGYLLKEEERLKAWEYTGITSIRYLADVVGGDFPGLQGPGAIANMIAGFLTDDERMFKQGWYDFKGTFTPGIVRQIQRVASGDRDWLTLFFYLEGRDFHIKKLKNKWEKGWKEYEDLEAKDRGDYRKDNPLIEAQMFITSKFSTLSSEEARQEVLRIIEANGLDTELIDGYEKIFGVDSNKELGELKEQLGQVELTEEGERKLKADGELDYYTTSNFASDVDKLVATVGRTKVEQDGNALAIEYLRAKDLFVQYDSLTTTEARTLYRQQFPDVEASLYLWGKISSFKNPKSADILLELMDKYNILPEAVPAFLEKPERYDELSTPLYELKRKTFDLDVLYEGLDEAERDQFKTDNPEWVDDKRRIQGYGKDVPEGLIDKYAEYYKLPTAGYEQERFLMENEDYYNDVWLGVLDNQPKDFTKVPSVEVEALYEEWQRMDLGKQRRNFEAKYPELDQWLHLTKGTKLEPTTQPEEEQKWQIPKREPTVPLNQLMSGFRSAKTEEEAYKVLDDAVGQYGQLKVKDSLSSEELAKWNWEIRASDWARDGLLVRLVNWGNEFYKVFEWLSNPERVDKAQLERIKKAVPGFTDLVVNKLLPLYQSEPSDKFPEETWNEVLKLAVGKYGVSELIGLMEQLGVPNQWRRIKQEIEKMASTELEAEGARMPFGKNETIVTIYENKPMTHQEFLAEVKRLEEEGGYLPVPGGVSYGTTDHPVYSMEGTTTEVHKMEIYDFIKGEAIFYIAREMDSGKVVLWKREKYPKAELIPEPWPWEEYEERGTVPHYLPEAIEGKEF